jgi:hypothetical protein
MTKLPHNISQKDHPSFWVHFRAIEWFAFPAFISQPLLPLILSQYPHWVLIVVVFCADLVWRFFCHLFVSVFLARTAYFLWRLRWVFAIMSAIYLYRNNYIALAIVTLLWPLFSTWISLITSWVAKALGTHASLLAVERRFADSIGLELPDPNAGWTNLMEED